MILDFSIRMVSNKLDKVDKVAKVLKVANRIKDLQN
jgi:hypothetical protein